MTFFLSDVTGKDLVEHFGKNIFICFFRMEHLLDMLFVKTNISCLHYHEKIFFRLIRDSGLLYRYCCKYYRKYLDY